MAQVEGWRGYYQQVKNGEIIFLVSFSVRFVTVAYHCHVCKILGEIVGLILTYFAGSWAFSNVSMESYRYQQMFQKQLTKTSRPQGRQRYSRDRLQMSRYCSLEVVMGTLHRMLPTRMMMRICNQYMYLQFRFFVVCTS